MQFIVLIIVSYLTGSIPFALIISKAHGKDLREVGSGNIGATNLARAVGRKWGYVCFLLDVIKGFLPTIVAGFFVTSPLTTFQLSLWIGVACAAVTGHIFPIYLKFKGGKGVATSFGVALGLWPYLTFCSLVSFALWVIVVVVTRYVSLASIIAAIAFPVTLTAAVISVANWEFNTLWPLLIVSVVIPLMVIIRHFENIHRLIRGDESKITGKDKANAEKVNNR